MRLILLVLVCVSLSNLLGNDIVTRNFYKAYTSKNSLEVIEMMVSDPHHTIVIDSFLPEEKIKDMYTRNASIVLFSSNFSNEYLLKMAKQGMVIYIDKRDMNLLKQLEDIEGYHPRVFVCTSGIIEEDLPYLLEKRIDILINTKISYLNKVIDDARYKLIGFYGEFYNEEEVKHFVYHGINAHMFKKVNYVQKLLDNYMTVVYVGLNDYTIEELKVLKEKSAYFLVDVGNDINKLKEILGEQ